MLRRVFSTAPQRRITALPKLHSLSKQSHQKDFKPLPSANGRFKKQGASLADTPKSPKQFSKYINDLPDAYDVKLVEKAILVVGSTLNREESSKILSVLGQRGSGEDLKRLRSVLSGPGRGMVSFDQDGLLRVIEGSTAKGEAGDALQWLLLAQEQPGFDPNPATLQHMLKSTSKYPSWDVLHFVCGEMDRAGVALRAEDVGLVVSAAAEQPHSRWRVVYDLLQRTPQTATTSTLALGLKVLADAQQFTPLKLLFEQHEASGQATHLALTALGTAAIRTGDFQFLKHALCSSARTLFAAESGVADSLARLADSNPNSPSAGGDEEGRSRWLSSFVDALWAVDSVKASAHVGLVVAWLLSELKRDAAVGVWNEHLSRMTQQRLESVVDLEAEHAQAVDMLVEHLSRFGAKAALPSQPVAAQFLHDVLFNSSNAAAPATAATTSSSAPSVVGTNFSVRSSQTAEDMIDLLAVTQDADGSAMVLSRSLKEGHLVSEKTMTTVLELLLRQKDYGLIMGLLDVYLSASNKGAVPASRWVKDKAAKPLPRVAAPFLFAPVLSAYVETGDLNGAVETLTVTIPSKGYIPRVSFHKTVIDALRKQGHHEKAVEIYTSGQALYKELTARGPEIRPNVPDHYGVAAPPLVHAALASCAEGRLAIAAMDIHAGYEESLSKGILRAGSRDRSIFAELVVRATASEDFIQIVPQFIQSLSAAHTPVLLTRELLTVALAAAVSQQNASVAREVVAIVEQAQGRKVSEVVSRAALLDALRDKFECTDQDAMCKFLLSTEELKNIK